MATAAWPKRQLGDLLDLFDYRRVPLNSRERATRQGPYPYYGASGIVDSIDAYIFEGRHILIAEDGENLRSRKTPISFFADGNFWVNNHAHIARAKPGVADDYFVMTVLESTDISGFITGAAQPKLTQANLKILEIPYPPLNIQRRIADILSAYDDLIEKNQKRIRILEDMARLLYSEWFVHFRFPGHEKLSLVDSPPEKVPETWRQAQLQEVIADGGAEVTTGPFGTQLHASDYVDAGTPVINVRNIGFGHIREEKLEFLATETVEKLRQHLLHVGDIVFGRKGAVERHVLVRRGQKGWFQGSDCLRLRLNAKSGLSPRILSQQFLTDDHKSWIAKQCSHGATMASLNQAIIGRVTVLIPPPELTTAADDHFSMIDALAERLREQAYNLRAQRDLLLPRLLSGEIDVSNLPDPAV